MKISHIFAGLFVALLLIGSGKANAMHSLIPAHATLAATDVATVRQPVTALEQGDDTFTHKDAGIQFHLPKGWKAEPDGEQITVTAPDNSFAVVFWVPAENTFAEAVKALDQELAKTIKNMKITDPSQQDQHNGMEHFAKGGTGEVEGVSVHWSVDLLQGKKPIIVLTFVSIEKAETHAAGYKELVMSIKKVQ
ncbi:MAG: hypothetical protein HY231_17680 [Acidobacteria bacterium]|nr:hypothetical protein [Acidobacteriota bacterium]